MTHTAGPFSVHVYSRCGKHSQGDIVTIGAGKTLIGNVDYSSVFAGYPHAATHAEMLANAALFIAAPDLLEALEKAVTRFEHCASMIDGGFGISGTLRAEHALKASHYALEAHAALTKARDVASVQAALDALRKGE